MQLLRHLAVIIRFIQHEEEQSPRQSCHAQADGGAQKDSSSSVMRPVPIHTASCLISLLQYIIRTVSLFCIFVTVHTRVPSNGILPMLRIPNRQNLLPELYRTEFSVQKNPTCEQQPAFAYNNRAESRRIPPYYINTLFRINLLYPISRQR